MTLNIKP